MHIPANVTPVEEPQLEKNPRSYKGLENLNLAYVSTKEAG